MTLDAVNDELHRATDKFPPFNSAHEGYAVILEELDELWEEIKGEASPSRMREEAIQVAAMAVRFVYDVCGDLSILAAGSAPDDEYVPTEWDELAEKGWVNYHALAAAYDDPSHDRGPIEACRAETCKFFVGARRSLIRSADGPVHAHGWSPWESDVDDEQMQYRSCECGAVEKQTKPPVASAGFVERAKKARDAAAPDAPQDDFIERVLTAGEDHYGIAMCEHGIPIRVNADRSMVTVCIECSERIKAEGYDKPAAVDVAAATDVTPMVEVIAKLLEEYDPPGYGALRFASRIMARLLASGWRYHEPGAATSAGDACENAPLCLLPRGHRGQCEGGSE